MKHEEALRIFSLDEIDNLSAENLKMLRNEYLLEFQLTEDPLVNFNGYDLDKNSVIEIFDSLKGSLDEHLEWHYASVLENFVQECDLTYLFNEAIQKRVIQAILSDHEKSDLLLKVLSDIIGETLVTPGAKREEHMQRILQITARLPIELEEKAYSHSFRYLRNELESIKHRFSNPFLDNRSLKLEPELNALVDVRFLRLFQLLPKKFCFLAYEYSLWCHTFVIKITQNREPDYSKYPIDSLLIIRNAALIAAEYYEEEEMLHLSSVITSMLQNPEKLFKNDNATYRIKNNRSSAFKQFFEKDSSLLRLFALFFIYLLMYGFYLILKYNL